MKIGPKFKIARRLGAPIFEKTQGPKFAQSLARKERSAKGGGRPKSEYGKALTEKQKARFTYGLSEKQFRGYVDKALHAPVPTDKLYTLLEQRLDNVLFRSGLAKTRSAARQIASHGHAMLNGKRVNVPSILVTKGDAVSLRAGSAGGPLFHDSSERMKGQTAPAWLEADAEMRTVKVLGEPIVGETPNAFDLGVVIEFYNR